MSDSFSITGRPQLPTSQQMASPGLKVQVSQPSQGGPLPGPDQRLQGLLDGLSAFNPLLGQMANQQQQQKQQSAVDQANADAQHVAQPVDALTGDPVQRPSSVPPAFDADYRRAYGIALAQRAALSNKEQMATAYEEQKKSPEFNLENFLQNWRQTTLQGVKDPLLQASLGAHLTETEAGIRNDYTGLQVQRHEEARNSTAYQLASGFTGDKSPQELGLQYFAWYLPQVNAIQIDKKQGASLFMERLQALSEAGKGRPELFDAMEIKDSEGFSILARNPQLQGAVIAAREHAQALHDKTQHEATEGARFSTLVALQDDAQNRPETINMNRLATAIGPDGLSVEQAVSILHTSMLAAASQAAASDIDEHAKKGQLGLYPEAVQKDWLNNRFAGSVQNLWDAATQPDQAPMVAGYASALMQAQSRYGSTVAVEPLQRLIEKNVSALPNPAGPDSGFAGAAAVYMSLAANPQYRDLYFKGDAAKVMEAYTQKAQTGVDPKTAYDAAYRLISPEYREAARKAAAEPDRAAKISAWAMRAAAGSSFFPRMLGGNGRPLNQGEIGVWASGLVRDAMTENLDLSEKDLQGMVERAAARTWAMDTTSNQAVKVPPGMVGDFGHAFSEFSADAAAAQKKERMWPDGSYIKYVPLNDQGAYQVQAWNGSRHQDLGTVTANQVLTRSAMKHTMTREEGSVAIDYRNALMKGEPVPDIDPKILGKAVFTGLIKQSELDTLKAHYGTQVADRLSQIPNMGFGQPKGTYTEVPKRGGAVVDNQLTSQVASDLFTGAGLTGGVISATSADPTLGIAASLTAAREGIALRAYADPAKGAGMNIVSTRRSRLDAHAGESAKSSAPAPPVKVASETAAICLSR